MNRRFGAWLLILIGMVVCRGLYLDDVFYNIDEAEYAVAADMLEAGGLPGLDLLGSTKPPGNAVLYLALFKIFGRSLTVLHVAQLLLAIMLGLFVVELAIRFWGMAAAIPASLLILMTANSFSLPSEMLALNVELPGMVIVLSGLLVGLRATKNWNHFWAGMLIGLAARFRQSLFLFLLPLIVHELPRTKTRFKHITLQVFGAAVPWIAGAIIYAYHGGLGWSIDSWFRYPAVYAADVGLAGFFTALVLNLWEFVQACWIPIAFAVIGKLVLLRDLRQPDRRFLFALAVVSFLALCSGSRFFGHYFYQIYPVIALLGVPGWLWLLRKSNLTKKLLYAMAGVGLLIAVAHFPLWPYWDMSAPRDGVPEASLTPARLEYALADYIRENTEPDQRIAIWGYCPQIYFLSDRLPAVRDYLCHYVTGFSTGSFDPFTSKPFRDSGHPQARAMFLDDLKQSQPELFVDLGSVRDYEYTFLHLPIRNYPELNDYVVSQYDPVLMLGEVRILKRK